MKLEAVRELSEAKAIVSYLIGMESIRDNITKRDLIQIKERIERVFVLYGLNPKKL